MLTMDDKERARTVFEKVEADLREADLSPEQWVKEVTRRISDDFPKMTMGELAGIVKESPERDRAKARRLAKEAAEHKRLMSIMRRDPHYETDTTGNCLRRLADAGDREAIAVLAGWDSPLSRAVEHIIDRAIDAAADWRRSEDHSIAPTSEESREFFQVIEDYIGATNFDLVASLPEDLQKQVNPARLTLALNQQIRQAKDSEI